MPVWRSPKIPARRSPKKPLPSGGSARGRLKISGESTLSRRPMRNGRGALSVAIALVLMALAAVGYALPPTFDPPPLSADPMFRSIPAQPAAERRALPHLGAFREEQISVQARGQRLEGTVRIPTTPGPHPAM